MANPALVSVNARFSHSNLALLYLKTALKYGCHLVEWDINRSKRGLIEELLRLDYSHYFFSVYIWNSEYLKTVITDLSTLKPDAIICCGGPEAVFNSNEWRKISGINFILDGNAEDFAAILPNLVPSSAPTIAAEIIKLSPKPFTETVFPYSKELLANLEGRLIYYEASRGCSFNCSYCLSAASGGLPDYRSEDQIREEIELLSQFNGTVKFVDRTFNHNKKISRLIWRMMTDAPPRGCFHFEIHPAILDEEDIRLLSLIPPRKARLEIGIQSTNQQVLNIVNRADSWEKSRENIRRLAEIDGLHIHLDQIIGLPGDSPEIAAETMNRILDLHPDIFQPGFLKVLHGTPLNAERDRFGIKASASPPYEILSSFSFSFSELQHFHQLETLVSILYNSGNFKLSLIYLSEKLGRWIFLFEALLNGTGAEGPADTGIKRWEYWGQRIFNLVKTELPDELPYLIDLLRLDWCPFANSQRYPGFIEYTAISEMNLLKITACKIASERYPDFTKSELKRSILFIPESRRGLTELTKKLFVRHRKRIIQISVE